MYSRRKIEIKWICKFEKLLLATSIVGEKYFILSIANHKQSTYFKRSYDKRDFKGSLEKIYRARSF